MTHLNSCNMLHYRVAQNKPDYLLLLSKFCNPPTKHVSDALNWSTWYSCFSQISHGDLLEPGWPSWLQMSSSTTARLSDVRTDRGRPVPLFLSALPVSSTLLIKAFKVLRFPLSRGKFSHHSKRCPSFSQLATHEIMIYRNLTNVNVHVHVRYMLSPVRLSVCLSSVCNAHAPYSCGCIFGNFSTARGTLAILWNPHKIVRRSSQGYPSAGGVKHKRGS